MGEVVLKLDNVSKTYYSKSYKIAKFLHMSKRVDTLERVAIHAVKSANLEAREGEILGLLGPNGAGKSTILKMICGLIAANSGTITLDGEIVTMNATKTREKIGALIESPSFAPKMSALQNLRYLASLQGGVTEERILDMAKLFDIQDRLKDKMFTYSMGMTQKIGVIQAIMHKPKLLILDEPTNGLDPKWIIEVREILKTLAKEYHMTIIISSHILSEMQELCDRVAIIDKGAIVMTGSMEELLGGVDDGKEELELNVDDTAKAIEIIVARGLEYRLVDNLIIVRLCDSEVSTLTREMVFAGVMLQGVNVKKAKLEDIFSKITSGGVNDDKQTALLDKIGKEGKDSE